MLAGDHKSGGKELFDELREHFTEAEIIYPRDPNDGLRRIRAVFGRDGGRELRRYLPALKGIGAKDGALLGRSILPTTVGAARGFAYRAELYPPSNL